MKHNLHSSNRRGKSLVVALSAALACVMLISSMGIVGEVYAKPNTATTGTGTVSETATVAEGTKFTVNYSSGAHAAFGAVTKEATADVSGCITLPGATFAEISGKSTLGYDCETLVGTDGWYYSFTGWQIVGQSKKIPAETVFQPGDVITPEVLTQYASNNTLQLKALWGKVYFIRNKYSSMAYEKVTRHYYSDGWKSANVIALNTNASGAATGAYDYKDGVANTGKNPGTPIATIDHLYSRFDADGVDPLDAYSTVAMLTGTLDYVKSRGTAFSYPTEAQLASKPAGFVAYGTQTNEWVDGAGYAWRYSQSRRFGETYNSRAVTFKSSQAAGAGTKYDFYYKVYDDEGQFRGSTRFDNVKLQCKVDSGNSFLGDACGVILRLYEGDPLDNGTASDELKARYQIDHHFETTARFVTPSETAKNPIAQIRADESEHVVINGGYFDSVSHSWDDKQSSDMPHSYCVGRNGSVTTINGGSTASDGDKQYTFPLTIVVTGGTAKYIYGTSASGEAGSSATGNRTIRIYGGEGHQPYVEQVNSARGAPLFANVDMLVKGCTNVHHVRGGGYNYTADVTGNISVRIEDSTIQKDVFGGGYYGDCLDDGSGTKGKVTVNVVNSTVKGTIYGSGKGNVNTVTFNTTSPQGVDNMPAWWDTPETGFSSVKSTGAIIQYVTHQLGRRSGVGDGASSVIWMKFTREAYLSVARVESSNITVTNSNVNTIFGGGDLGHVAKDTNIQINGSTVGTVYGGSDGTASLPGITIYQPCDDKVEVDGQEVPDYLGPRPNGPDANGNYEWEKTNYATRRDGKTKYEYESLGTYSWASGEPGINHDTKQVYSTEMSNAGVVGGDTHITITGSSKVTGAVYGGGNAGRVNGSTTVDIESGTINSGVSVYGGGKSASVAGTEVNIKGGTFGSKGGDIFGGGDAGAVTGGTVVNIEAGTFGGARVFGGGKSAPVASTSVNITGGNFSSNTGLVYGGGQNGSVTGAVEITVKDLSNPINYQIVGGGYSGTVGSVTLELENSTFLHHIYGGGDLSSATVLGEVTINATDITHGTPGDDNTHNYTLYGGGYKANVNGTITVNLNNGFFEWIHGGGYQGVCKDVTVNLRGGKAATDPYGTRATTQPVVAWCLRGGGDAGQCEDVVINMWAGDLSRNTHTAGNDCTVASSTINIYGGYTENIYGGGDHGNVKGNSQVNLYGGRVATIYGGGDRPTSRVGGSGVLVNDAADSTAALTIAGTIYGGSDQGIIMAKGTSTQKLIGTSKTLKLKSDNSKTTTVSTFDYGTGPSVNFQGTGNSVVEFVSGTTSHGIYAGCNGGQTSDANEQSGNNHFGSILGKDADGYSAKLLVTGGTIGGDVYGGNRAAGHMAGGTLVEISGGTVAGYVIGGSYGVAETYNTDYEETFVSGGNKVGADITGTATVRITGGTVCSSGKYVFGGNFNGGTVGATSVEITGMSESALKSTSVYGGNRNGGTVTGQAAVTVTNSTVNYPFGGNLQGGTVGSTSVILSGANVKNAYGGNDTNGTVSGPASVSVGANTTLINGAFGGNFKDGTVGSTTVYFANSTCTNADVGIFGGNNQGGTVTDDTAIFIYSGVYLRAYGGNLQGGTVGGDTWINIQQGVADSNLSPYIYGGNNNGGTVSGNSNIVYNGPAAGYHLTGVFGGNYNNGTVAGKANITIEQGNVWHILAGGNHFGGTVGTAGSANSGAQITILNNGKSKTIATPYGGNYRGGTIHGDVTLDIQAGLVEYFAFGGNYQEGTINGNVTVNVAPAADIIKEALENDANYDRGLYGGNCEGGTINGNVTVNLTGCVDEIPYVVGGNLSGDTINGNVTVNMTNGDVKYLYGGNNAGGTITGNTTVNLENSVDAITALYGGNLGGGTINGLATVNMSGGTVENLFGGSNAGGHIGTKGKANTGVAVNMSGGVITLDLYGGSNMSGTIAGTMNISMTGGEIRSDLFGGGNQADVTADVTALNVTIGGDAKVVQYQGNNGGWLYAGGNQADCAVVPKLTVQENANLRFVFGGANAGDVPGTNVNILGGEIQGLFGGSNAGSGSVTGNTSVKMSGGKISSIRGGGNYAITKGNTNVEVTGGTVTTHINGAGNKSTVEGNAKVVVSGGTVANIYGGADSGSSESAYLYGDATVIVEKNANITGSVFGAGNNEWAHSYGDTDIRISGGTIGGSVYGGGNKGLMEIDASKNPDGGDTAITVTGGTIKGSVYGGGNNAPVPGNATINCTKLALEGTLYGGGNNGELDGDVSITVNSGTVKGNIFGGGADADVGGKVNIAIKDGSFNKNVYGGGEHGDVTGRVTMNITGGDFNNAEQTPVEVYGGGKNGTVYATKVDITGGTNISGSVFGGGEGFTATVYTGTDVHIDIPFSFQVHEEIYTTDDITSSGRVESQLIPDMNTESGAIAGSVYGGGNLGRVGQGTISAGGDKADIHTEATTKVQIDHGQILGSVFGGGRGIPDAGVTYDIRMGTVFGGTDVDILGGLIMGNVYGGGEQSRVYATGTDRKAATVDIIETATNEAKTEFEKIGINGSVFGGGDRGESDAANASVPTVYGDVEVTIQGHPDNQPSEIYFLTGGVYGDGNLCLVDGNRKITVKDFEPSTDRKMLKTFFSLQRADLAVLDNSAVVLLGARDLVEEGDTKIYSINRIGQLQMLNGSTVKLDQIVKYMGGLYSDIHDDIKYIHDGRNGFTNTYDQFTSCNGTCLSPLTDQQVKNYHNNVEPHTEETKNVLCVANGLYLEVVDESDVYGEVTGLFTLQLTYANPGEGGGFVYASIPESTGDFICETERWSFNAYDEGAVTAENYQELLRKNEVFIRVTGKGFRRPGDTFDASQTYFSREKVYDSEGHVIYMDIIDDVGGVTVSNGETTGYTYYYWYIGGPSVTFDVDVTGYIGAATTEFQAKTTLPQHADIDRAYVLYGVEVSEEFADAVDTGGDYALVQTDAVTGQQIAVELRAKVYDSDAKKYVETSLGFLYYDPSNDVWGIMQGGNVMTGYLGSGDAEIVKNNLLITMAVGPSNDQLTWVLHKSNDVAKTCSGLEVYLDIDLFEAFGTGNPVAVTTGTSSLSYTTSLSIVRLTATQSAFVQNGGNYNGVASNETVHITGSSKFTAEWQTRYVPAANPKEDGMFMTWGLSTREYTYYMSSSGEYFTLDESRTKALNQSDGLNISDFNAEFTESGTGYRRVSDNEIFSLASSFSANPIPTGTRITMVDMNGSTPAYYYYICTGDKSYIDLQDFKLMGTNTTIRSLADSAKPAFIKAYDAQTMSMITERLVFVFDVSGSGTNSSNEFVGGLTLQHMYGNNQKAADILDYAKIDDLDGKYDRYAPKDLAYKFHPTATGVNANTYTASFEATAYNDIGNAVLNVHVEEDTNWINTLFRENGFAVKVSLVDANGNSQPMPAGMYFEYRGEHYYPGPDSTYVSVPVHEFGDHEIIIHNPQFSLATAAGGNTARFKVEYYSAPDANYYNSFNTQVFQNASYSIIASDSYSLKVESGDDIQIYESGETVKVAYTTAKSDGAAAKTVAVTAYSKAGGKYTELDWQKLFSGAQSKTMAEGTEVVCQWTIADNAVPGTYRLVFTYADHTEYVNIIIIK